MSGVIQGPPEQKAHLDLSKCTFSLLFQAIADPFTLYCFQQSRQTLLTKMSTLTHTTQVLQVNCVSLIVCLLYSVSLVF